MASLANGQGQVGPEKRVCFEKREPHERTGTPRQIFTPVSPRSPTGTGLVPDREERTPAINHHLHHHHSTTCCCYRCHGATNLHPTSPSIHSQKTKICGPVKSLAWGQGQKCGNTLAAMDRAEEPITSSTSPPFVRVTFLERRPGCFSTSTSYPGLTFTSISLHIKRLA